MRGFKEVNSLRGVVVTFFPATSYQRSKLKSGQKEARPHRPLRLSRGSRIGTQRPPLPLSPLRLRYSWCKNIPDIILCIQYIILSGIKAPPLPNKLDWGITDLNFRRVLACTHVDSSYFYDKDCWKVFSQRQDGACCKDSFAPGWTKIKTISIRAAPARRKDPRQFSGSQAAWNVQEISVLMHFTDYGGGLYLSCVVDYFWI